MTEPLTRNDLERFWEKVEIDPATGCWNWTGNFTSDKGSSGRLPKLTLRGKEVGARRLSYLIHFNQLPKKIGCTCGNKKCVSPRHLTPEVNRSTLVGKDYTSRSSENWVPMDEHFVRKVLTLKRKGMSGIAIARKLDTNQGKIALILKMAKFCQQNKLRPYRDAKKVA